MTIKAILTGHSRGLGQALANALRARGIATLSIARTPPDRSAHDAHALDLADPAALASWLEAGHMRRFLDDADSALLINNAGTVQPMGLADTLAPDRIAQSINLNVSAPLMLASAFLAATARLADRRILHVSSGAARTAYAGWTVYCASKAALDHHARALASEALAGVRVCSLAPGIIDTDMQAEIRAMPEAAFPLRSRFEALHTDGALASPVAVAEDVIAHLLDARFGEVLVADLRTLPR